ncbi:hypothetical protein LMG3410_02095 [Achromobacter aegrifaciens]|uniref:hypothetical protein n=1 Tax=Achromobacter aegrifaciens TaxID=1287736 RepID=UPI001465224C|nr:hypothetical protein [Achromobacter aegrifaciens]CAB3857301.1 hypothetical protein LMG3410_02095 [Achromobacter aegrifaciens]
MNKKLTRIGIGVTAIYLIAVVLLGWGQWDEFSGMKPNEVGDFLAGVVGPLALLWLILGFFQQGEELRLSTDALKQQAKELSESVQHQEALVYATRQQVEVQMETLKREQRLARDALRPIFSFYLQTIEISSGSTTFHFELQNLGHRATNLVIDFRSASGHSPLVEHRELNREGQIKVAITGVGAEHAGDHQIEIRFLDGAGERGAVAYPLSISAGSFGGMNAKLGEVFELTDC